MQRRALKKITAFFAMKHFENLNFFLEGHWTILQRLFEAQNRQNRSSNELRRRCTKYEDFFYNRFLKLKYISMISPPSFLFVIQWNIIKCTLLYYLAPNFVWERGIVLLVWVCDSVCLGFFFFVFFVCGSVINITQNVLGRFQ